VTARYYPFIDEGSDVAVYTGGLTTMVDSDGLIKWAPHNVVSNSYAPWVGVAEPLYDGFFDFNGVVTGTIGVSDPYGTTLAGTISADTDGTLWRYINNLGAAYAGANITFGIWVRRRSGSGTITLLRGVTGGDIISPTGNLRPNIRHRSLPPPHRPPRVGRYAVCKQGAAG